MYRLSSKLLFFALFVIFSSLMVSSFAQQGAYNAFSINLNNSYPSPGESVTVRLQSNKSQTSGIRSVRWFINGEEKNEFLNQLIIEQGNEGVAKQITANITYFDIFEERKFVQITAWIRPTLFDILWEGDVVTTPRYVGQKLAGPGTPINLSAKIQYIATDGTVYTEKDFSFRWEIESEFYGDVGPGASHIVYEEGGTYLNNFILVKSRATLINRNNVSFEKSITIPIIEPRVLVYPHTLLYGLFGEQAISESASLLKQPLTLSVYPFYFSASDFDKNAIQYRWFVNNAANHSKEGRKIDISIEGENISIPFRVVSENKNERLQKTEHDFTFNL